MGTRSPLLECCVQHPQKVRSSFSTPEGKETPVGGHSRRERLIISNIDEQRHNDSKSLRILITMSLPGGGWSLSLFLGWEKITTKYHAKEQIICSAGRKIIRPRNHRIDRFPKLDCSQRINRVGAVNGVGCWNHLLLSPPFFFVEVN